MRRLCTFFLAGLVSLTSGCAGDEAVGVDALQLEGAWVFAYSQPQTVVMQALTSGEAAVVEGCLQVGDAVVIWEAEHLDAVEEILLRVNAGESLTLQLGGGGQSLSEGSTLQDFPDILQHCSPAAVWSADAEAPTILAL